MLFDCEGWTVINSNAFKKIEKEPEVELKRKENYSVFDLAEKIVIIVKKMFCTYSIKIFSPHNSL